MENGPGSVEPITSAEVFLAVRRNLEARYHVRVSEEVMLQGLARLLQEHGNLSARIFQDAEGLACPQVYRKRFGGFLQAFEGVGSRLT